MNKKQTNKKEKKKSRGSGQQGDTDIFEGPTILPEANKKWRRMRSKIINIIKEKKRIKLKSDECGTNTDK